MTWYVIFFEEKEFIEIYVKCSMEECERRDPKVFYHKARMGEIPHFTGINAPYEAPLKPEIIIESDKQTFKHRLWAIFTITAIFSINNQGLERRIKDWSCLWTY